MKWSPQQDNALKAINDWIRNSDQQLFRMFGYAGTGKTTLARHAAEYVDGGVLFGAFTGKAAYVLQSKGCEGARTIHSMIYHSKEKGKKQLQELEEQLNLLLTELRAQEMSEADIARHKRVKDFTTLINAEKESMKQPFFSLNPESDVRHANLVIIDECSMVDERMGKDLLSFGKKVLVLGDPAQLPPVGGGGIFTENVTPDVMLTDIHRQAAESPIIRMATDTRNHKSLNLGDYGNGCEVTDGRVDQDRALRADQILVGRNKTRFASNAKIRKLMGYDDPYPVSGDKLVCLRNNNDSGLLNGSLFFVDSINGKMDNKVMMDIAPDNNPNVLQTVISHEHYFLGQGDELQWYERKEAEEFDYGYALTVHKAQGSQWNDVLLIDESDAFKKDKWRWLYTGITRAAETITIARV